MAVVTIKQLAIDLGVSTDLLISQLQNAGINVTDENDAVTAEQKQELLLHLKRSHGLEIKTPKKITLKRTTVSELKGGVHKSVTKVKVRRKKTYEPLAPVAEEEVPPLQDTELLETTDQVITSEVAIPDSELETQTLAAAESENVTEIPSDTSYEHEASPLREAKVEGKAERHIKDNEDRSHKKTHKKPEKKAGKSAPYYGRLFL